MASTTSVLLPGTYDPGFFKGLFYRYDFKMFSIVRTYIKVTKMSFKWLKANSFSHISSKR